MIFNAMRSLASESKNLSDALEEYASTLYGFFIDQLLNGAISNREMYSELAAKCGAPACCERFVAAVLFPPSPDQPIGDLPLEVIRFNEDQARFFCLIRPSVEEASFVIVVTTDEPPDAIREYFETLYQRLSRDEESAPLICVGNICQEPKLVKNSLADARLTSFGGAGATGGVRFYRQENAKAMRFIVIGEKQAPLLLSALERGDALSVRTLLETLIKDHRTLGVLTSLVARILNAFDENARYAKPDLGMAQGLLARIEKGDFGSLPEMLSRACQSLMESHLLKACPPTPLTRCLSAFAD